MLFRTFAVNITLEPMADIAAQIRENTRELVRLNERIHETVRFRSRSEADRDEWGKACEEFHRRFDDLIFPGGSERWEAFLRRDPAEVNSAVAFLEVDPWFFRSGYLKQIIWDRLKRTYLNSEQMVRLERVAQAYLHKRVQREFWHMVRFFRVRGSVTFWELMGSLAKTKSGEVSLKAHWMLLAKQNVPVRNRIGREFLRTRYQSGYIPDLWLG
jgi:hypothetical protein